MNKTLKVQFEFTTNEIAEVAERAANRSQLIKNWRMRNKFISVGIVGLFGVLLYAALPWAAQDRAVFVIAVCGLMLLPGKLLTNKRMLKYYKEHLGGDGPFLCEVELTPDAVITRQAGVEIKHSWPQVESVTEIKEGIELIYRPMDMLLVRNRAFATPQARREFLELSRLYVDSHSK